MPQRYGDGVLYFSMYLGFSKDRKILRLRKRFGVGGVGLLMFIFEYIYGLGYYAQWDDLGVEQFCREYGIPEKEARDFVDYCIEINIFHPGMFYTHLILTSNRIQSLYFTATKNRRVVDIVYDYLLYEGEIKGRVNQKIIYKNLMGEELNPKNLPRPKPLLTSKSETESEPAISEYIILSAKNQEPTKLVEQSVENGYSVKPNSINSEELVEVNETGNIDLDNEIKSLIKRYQKTDFTLEDAMLTLKIKSQILFKDTPHHEGWAEAYEFFLWRMMTKYNKLTICLNQVSPAEFFETCHGRKPAINRWHIDRALQKLSGSGHVKETSELVHKFSDYIKYAVAEVVPVDELAALRALPVFPITKRTFTKNN